MRKIIIEIKDDGVKLGIFGKFKNIELVGYLDFAKHLFVDKIKHPNHPEKDVEITKD